MRLLTWWMYYARFSSCFRWQSLVSVRRGCGTNLQESRSSYKVEKERPNCWMRGVVTSKQPSHHCPLLCHTLMPRCHWLIDVLICVVDYETPCTVVESLFTRPEVEYCNSTFLTKILSVMSARCPDIDHLWSRSTMNTDLCFQDTLLALFLSASRDSMILVRGFVCSWVLSPRPSHSVPQLLVATSAQHTPSTDQPLKYFYLGISR